MLVGIVRRGKIVKSVSQLSILNFRLASLNGVLRIYRLAGARQKPLATILRDDLQEMGEL
jgi:hypothetical protein